MRLNKYYATGSCTTKHSDLPKGYFIEHNAAINMYRLNHKRGVPSYVAGYTPHLKALQLAAKRVAK